MKNSLYGLSESLQEALKEFQMKLFCGQFNKDEEGKEPFWKAQYGIVSEDTFNGVQVIAGFTDLQKLPFAEDFPRGYILSTRMIGEDFDISVQYTKIEGKEEHRFDFDGNEKSLSNWLLTFKMTHY